MQPIEVETLSASDTATMLRAKLGPLRSWPDFLSDNIRGRQSICGLRLKPCARMYDGPTLRPRYALADIEKFIADVQAIEPAARPTPFEVKKLRLLYPSWRLNTFDKDGNPVVQAPPPSTMHRPSPPTTH